MRYRPRTNDFEDKYGRIWDIYDIDKNKKNIKRAKFQIKLIYRYKRIIKRKDGYYLLVREPIMGRLI